MGDYVAVELPETIIAPNHWAAGKKIDLSEVAEVWVAAETFNNELKDYFDDLKSQFNQIAAQDIICFDGTNDLIEEKINSIQKDFDQYYDKQMVWITDCLKASKKAFEDYRDKNKHSCALEQREEVVGQDEHGEDITAVISYHKCGCGERLADSCTLCGSGGE